jgi:hypothetical protein
MHFRLLQQIAKGFSAVHKSLYCHGCSFMQKGVAVGLSRLQQFHDSSLLRPFKSVFELQIVDCFEQPSQSPLSSDFALDRLGYYSLHETAAEDVMKPFFKSGSDQGTDGFGLFCHRGRLMVTS